MVDMVWPISTRTTKQETGSTGGLLKYDLDRDVPLRLEK